MKSEPLEIRPPQDRTVQDLGRNTLIALIEQIPFASLVTPTLDAALPSRSQEEQARWQEDVSASLNSTASRVSLIETFIRASLAAHAYQSQAGRAGELSFFRGGMLTTLEKIAAGKATARDINTLTRQLRQSRQDVEQIIADIELAMSRFVDGDPFKERMRVAIHGEYGKLMIREKIAAVTETDWRDPTAKQLAKRLCIDIDKFNRAVVALAQAAASAHPMELPTA